MHTITQTTEYETDRDESFASDGQVAVDGDIENLVVRIAGSDEGEKIDELAVRAGGARRPSGALMLAAVNGTVLAASSMSRHEAVNEPTLSGLAARAVVEYTLADLERRRRIPRRAA